GDGDSIVYGRSAHFSGASAKAPTLRAHTSIVPARFAVAGVHDELADALHSCSTAHPVALKTHHLNSIGAVPPVTVAVSVIVVPGGCGAARFAVMVSAVICTPGA